MQRRSISTAVATAIALLLAGSSAAAGAGPGETFPTASLPLPPGAIAGGTSGQDELGYPAGSAVSADGRYVAFLSSLDVLSAAAQPDRVNVFRKDRVTGDVVLVSRASGAAGAAATISSEDVTISDDGGRVAWTTTESLVPADTDGGRSDVYVRELATNQTLLATAFAGADDDIYDYDLSGNGAWIAFTSDERFAVGDTNAGDDVYRAAVAGGVPLLVSARDGGNVTGDAEATGPSISGDGTWVAFTSAATDLVAGMLDANRGGTDVFARDVTAGRTRLVSNASGLVQQTGNESSSSPLIAGSPASGGSTNVTIAYNSYATDLAPAGTDLADTLSVYRRNLGARFSSSSLVSRADGVAGVNAGASAYAEGVSADGRIVVFATDAHNLGPAANGYGIYVRDTTTGTTVLGSTDNRRASVGAISGDGSLLLWYDVGAVTPDAAPDASGIFARAYAAPAALGAPELVSRPPGGSALLLPALSTEAAEAGEQTISADGRYVLLSGYTSRDIVGLGDLGSQIYRRDTLTGALELVSRATGPGGAPIDEYATDQSISADGTRVVFSTYAALDASDLDAEADVYVRDLAAATTTLVSRADGPGGADADAAAQDARISADGTHVAFASAATNLGTPGVDRHVYLRDLTHGTTTVVDRATGLGGALADGESEGATMSADGRLVAFVSFADNLDPADPGPATDRDVYVRDTVANTLVLVSRRDGAGGQKAAGGAQAASISADGRVVAFETGDDALAPEGGAWAQRPQVVARDLETATDRLVSRAPGGLAADAPARAPAISGDGGVVAFASEATNLLPGVGGTYRSGVFARSLTSGGLVGPPAFGLVGNGAGDGSRGPSLSEDGQCLAFTANGHNAVSGFAGDMLTAYVYVISGSCPKALAGPGSGGAGGPDGGSGGQPRTPGGGGSAVRPALTRVSLLRARFRVGRGATAVTAANRKAAKRKAKTGTAIGTAVRFTLNTRATVSVAIERSAAGRDVGGSCRRPAPRLRRRRACVRWTKAGTLTRRSLPGGRRSVAFSGRIGRRALPPGRYRATVRAGNASGSSKPVALAFTVVRR
jgi:Tol biopolymer transport system component